MRVTRKISFRYEELQELINAVDGYLWIAIDIKRAMIVGGDVAITESKRELLKSGSKIYDIFGIGLDLVTGEIDYYSPINEKKFVPGSTKEVPEDKRARIESLVNYFFEELAAYKDNR